MSHDPPIEGHDAMALPLQVELDSEELLLQRTQIPVVTQDSQEGEYFHHRLRLLFVFNGLTLWPVLP
jgi:hypothetical protein